MKKLLILLVLILASSSIAYGQSKTFGNDDIATKPSVPIVASKTGKLHIENKNTLVNGEKQLEVGSVEFTNGSIDLTTYVSPLNNSKIYFFFSTQTGHTNVSVYLNSDEISQLKKLITQAMAGTSIDTYDSVGTHSRDTHFSINIVAGKPGATLIAHELIIDHNFTLTKEQLNDFVLLLEAGK